MATGHNLTDEASSFVTNFFNVDLHFLTRSKPVVDSGVDLLIPRIKPLFYVAEPEIIMYAYYSDIKHESIECEYSSESPNLQIKQVLESLEQDRRGLMIMLMRKYQKVLLPIIEAGATKTVPQMNRKCQECGMPASRNKCAFCRNKKILLKHLKQIDQNFSTNEINLENEEEK